jgi:DnaJ homolog subfamily C member 9
MASLLEQAFGTSDLNLYDDVLLVSRTCTQTQLRKAYYKQALKYHPDKSKSKDAKFKFQAISWAYNFLKDPTKRQVYDRDGVIARNDDDDEDDEAFQSWKDYFDLIFGKISTDDIDAFAMKYKMSDEEEKDVLETYVKYNGNLLKMLEYVMLSEERDVPRWVEDYIRPAVASGKVEDFEETLSKTLGQIEKKLQQNGKKRKIKKGAHKDLDPDETETEGSEDQDGDDASTNCAKVSGKKKVAARKGKPTKAKSKSTDQDLVAAIRNKNGRGDPLASIAARYGVALTDDDLLEDAAFTKLQAKVSRKKGK